MRKLLFHIGMHKSASTWMQQELFIRDNPYFYPVSMHPKGHSSLARSFIYSRDNQLLNSFDLNASEIHREFEECAKVFFSPSKIGVISHERLSGNPHAGAFDAATIARRIHNSFPLAKVFFLIREQKSFILSNYFQYLKAGGSDELERYLNKSYDGKRPGFSWESLKFHHLISTYLELFGKENLLVLPYELFKKDPEQFLKELGNFLEIEIKSDHVNLDKIHNQNAEPFLAYRLRKRNSQTKPSSLNNSNEVDVGSKMLYKGLYTTLKGFGSNKMNEEILVSLTSIISESTGDRFIKSNELLSSMIGIDLKKFGY